MQQQRGRWPAPVACRLRDRALLWDPAELRAVVQGEAVIRSRRPAGAEADGLVSCLECGRRFRSLGPHLRAHGMSAAQYREQHRLPASTVLMATDTRAALAATRQEAMGEDPEILARMRAGALPRQELARRSAEARAGTDDLPAVRQARRRGWDESVRRSAEARRKQRERTAKTAGYRSWEQAIAETRHLPAQTAAAALGVGKTTVRRWRVGLAARRAEDDHPPGA